MGLVEHLAQKTVNSRPEVAYGILCLSFYPPSSVDDTKKFSIEKLFGLVKEDNSVLKFRIQVNGSWERSETSFDLKVSHNVYYLSDEPIHCDLTIKDHAGERYSIIHTSMSCLDIRRFLVISDDEDIKNYQIEFKIGQDSATQNHAKIVTNYANKFNNESTSDFRVKCSLSLSDKVFHVHKWILADRSEFFAAILRNNCLENKNEQLVIDDFKPHIVSMLLRFIYNGTLNLPFYESFDEMSDDLSDLMQIADKYNFMDLFDTCDTILAQYLAVNLSKFTNDVIYNFGIENPENDAETDASNLTACVRMLVIAIRMFSEVQARKCAATIFLWKQEADLDSEFDDTWSGLMNDYSDFVTLAAKTASRKDYRKWHDQHRTWTFHTVIEKNRRNSIAFIVGPFGDMKGAVQCAGQPIV